jgi:hypothetical protein
MCKKGLSSKISLGKPTMYTTQPFSSASSLFEADGVVALVGKENHQVGANEHMPTLFFFFH